MDHTRMSGDRALAPGGYGAGQGQNQRNTCHPCVIVLLMRGAGHTQLDGMRDLILAAFRDVDHHPRAGLQVGSLGLRHSW